MCYKPQSSGFAQEWGNKLASQGFYQKKGIKQRNPNDHNLLPGKNEIQEMRRCLFMYLGIESYKCDCLL